MTPCQPYLPLWNRNQPTGAPEKSVQRIEECRAGYPRFTALLSAYKPYFLCRGFGKLRARLLLLKQDRLVGLEERLAQIDQQETSPLFLGMSRCDRNSDRTSLLSEVDSCLADYDLFLERTSRMLQFEPAQPRDIKSLQNWLDGNGCIAREETAYLAHRELVCLAPVGDSAILQLEAWVEDKLIKFHRDFRKGHFHDSSNDPNVYIYSGPLIHRSAKAILLFLITLLLLMPVVICNIVSSASNRIIVVMASTVSYLFIISGLTRSKTMELILAGATYATVLTVFVSGGNTAQ